ncbi:Dihydrodipicolinate synthase/N-acetylneuraminate lyase [Herbiconiux ginsengi]|uniref:Dihydrodipicolinate synthase/N-acetylneuraminate lyase n=2 Tax=Herbiconiux ginsengi TaxID=381665 RepID=A0A1H3TGI4_9MICO|nr:Dihydrodipicolinate synthase/N-acetylneuraminate lyase [Herbiconiux ginsengi]
MTELRNHPPANATLAEETEENGPHHMTIASHKVIASVALPMAANGDPDFVAFRRYLRWLADEQGITAFAINADTGEGAHLDNPERLRTADAVREEFGDTVYLVSGLIATHDRAAKQLASDLATAGTDALLMFTPPAFAGTTVSTDALVGYYSATREAGLPLIAFSLMADVGGVTLTPDTLAPLCAVPDLIAAVKDASFDARAYVRTRDLLTQSFPNVELLTGCDNFILESYILGAHGSLLGFAGLAGAATLRLHDLVHAGRIAEAIRWDAERIAPLASVMYGEPIRDNRSRLKEALVHLGVIDAAHLRAPLRPVAEADRERMLAAVDRTFAPFEVTA